jgi:hypothetical protein
MQVRNWTRTFAALGASVVCTGAVAVLPSSPASAGEMCGAPGHSAEGLPSLPSGTGEVSGLAASSAYPGWGWMVRDSGHPASLYAVSLHDDRRLSVREVPVEGAHNRDWEDIVYEARSGGRGRLWILESGQSGGNRYLYEVEEPDPTSAATARLVARYSYRYPDGDFNTEAALLDQGHLVLVAKTNPSRVYRFRDPLVAEAENRPDFVGVLPDSQYVSVARLAPDGRVLVLADHGKIWVYESPTPGQGVAGLVGKDPARVTRVASGDNVESGDWFPSQGCAFVLMAESSNVYGLSPTALGIPAPSPTESAPSETDPPPVVPESPLPVLLPLSAVVVVALGVFRPWSSGLLHRLVGNQ